MTWYNGSFGYDHVNRLTSAGDAGWSRSFSYDQYANMSVTSSSNVPLNGMTPTNQGGNAYNPANNRLLSAGYDAAGNMGTVGALSFWYDAEGRQTQSYDAGSHTTANYTYDADGQRVQKVLSNGPTTVYIHDAFGQLAAEYASSAPTPPCTTCYLSYDHLGSVRLITDQNAQVISRHDYLPFGEEIPNGSGGRGGNGFGAPSSVNQMFTGQERDGELVPNADYFNARYFMGVLGSFMQPDPANAGADLYNPQSWNAYAYVLGNPLNGVDPSGMDSIGGWDDGGGCDWFDPSCWPISPCIFDICGGGGGGGGNGGGSGGGGTSSNTPRSTPLPPNSFPGGETLGLPPGMRVPLPSPAVMLGLNLNLNCEFGVCVGGASDIIKVEDSSSQQFPLGSHPKPSDLVFYAIVRSYLMGEPGMRSIFKWLENSPNIYTIKLTGGDDEYDPSTRTISWNAHQALACSTGGTQSPALGLGHELAHARGPMLPSSFAPNDYDYIEERRVINGPERTFALFSGECVRTNHRGSPFNVANPIMH